MTVSKRVRRGKGITPAGLDGIMRLKLSPKQKIAVLKRALFSKGCGLRMAVAEDLIRMGEFRFLLKMASRMRRQDFPSGAFDTSLKIKLEERFKREFMKGPSFKFRGFEVYETEVHFPSLGTLYDGRIVIWKKYPQILKPVLCAHEIGEVFCHKIGIAMELLELKRRNLENDYARYLKAALPKDEIDFLRQRIQIIRDYMPEMGNLEKELLQILKAMPSLERGP